MVDEISDDDSDQSEVEHQTELMYKDDTIWTAVYKADKNAIDALIDTDPNIINKRGAVGECPIHMLFLCGTNEHLTIARDLITRFPHIATQIYNKPVGKYCFFLDDTYRYFRYIMVKIFFILLLSNVIRQWSNGYLVMIF